MTFNKWCSAEKPANSCSLLSMPDRGVDQRRWIFVRSNASTHLVGLTLSSTRAWERLIGLPCSTQYCMSVQLQRSAWKQVQVKAPMVDDLATMIRQLTLSVRAHCAGPVPVHTEIRQRAVLRRETCQRQASTVRVSGSTSHLPMVHVATCQPVIFMKTD
jgi:hypothetical protein